MHERPAPVGGPLTTRPLVILALLVAGSLLLMTWRFVVGLGAATGLNDGYPWGLWIAYDVVTGTALACGGYAVALMVYVLNRGRYHALVRPAVLTSALGYSLAALAVVLDLGRPWNMWKIPLPWKWNLNSVLLEVALCIGTYFAVLWIELSPAFLEKLEGSSTRWVRDVAAAISRPLERALPWILALGMTLPTMHQSSLGALLLVAKTKLHPLWHTGLLPLLYLVSVIGMGFAVVVFEGAITSLVLRRPPETRMLSKLSGAIPWVMGAWVLIRFVDLGLNGRLGLTLSSGALSGYFWTEIGLTLLAVGMLLPAGTRVLPMTTLFRAAVLLLVAGSLYRFDTFLVAFNPGAGWAYFPKIPEMLITVGLITIEILGYAVIVKVFPILTGRPRAAAPAPVVARGVA